MSKKYYNGVLLPELPASLDTATYPVIIVSKVTADGSYAMFCFTETTIYAYPSEQKFWILDQSTAIRYITTADATEWTLVGEPESFAQYSYLYYEGLEPFFSTYAIMDAEIFSYFLSASFPIDFYWDWSDTEGKVEVIITGEDVEEELPFQLYKILDEVYTYEQLQTMSGFVRLDLEDEESSSSYSYTVPITPEDIDVKSPPFLIFGTLTVCPVDNYVIEQDGVCITFPEKGVYSLVYNEKIMSDLKGGGVGLNFPTCEPVVLYDGNITTIKADGDYYVTDGAITFSEPIAKRDIVLSTLDGEHIDTVESMVNIESLIEWTYYGSDLSQQGIDPTFEDRDYCVVLINSQTASCGVSTKSALTEEPMKVVRLMPGSVNKIAREVELNTETVSLDIGETLQLEVLHDNAIFDTVPTYTFSGGSATVATVSETGLITAVNYGSTTATIKSESTKNYHDCNLEINIRVQKPFGDFIVSADKYQLDVGETTQISLITDSAMEEEPTYTLESADESIATVNDLGIITAVSDGFTVINVTRSETTSYSSITVPIQISVGDYDLQIKRSTLNKIGNSVRNKTGKKEQIPVLKLSDEIDGIEAKAEPKLQNKTVTENGTYVADSGYDGLGEVVVYVEGSGGASGSVGAYSIKPHILTKTNQTNTLLGDIITCSFESITVSE